MHNFDFKEGDMIALDPTSPKRFVIVGVSTTRLEVHDTQRGYTLRPSRKIPTISLPQPKKSPAIISRPGRPTRWRS